MPDCLVFNYTTSYVWSQFHTVTKMHSQLITEKSYDGLTGYILPAPAPCKQLGYIFTIHIHWSNKQLTMSPKQLYVLKTQKRPFLIVRKWPIAVVSRSDPKPWCVCCLLLTLVSHLPSNSNFLHIWWLNMQYYRCWKNL